MDQIALFRVLCAAGGLVDLLVHGGAKPVGLGIRLMLRALWLH